MKTHKAQNAAILARYKLPASLTGEEIARLSLGAFANHSFTLATGEHVTAISAGYLQLRKGDRIRDLRLRETPAEFAAVMALPFNVAPEFDPTW